MSFGRGFFTISMLTSRSWLEIIYVTVYTMFSERSRAGLKIILTNDDGIEAPGLKILESVIKKFGTPVVVAPAEPMSGVGHQVTTLKPIHVKEINENRFRVEGTPVDCARIALTRIASDAEWLFSGINPGGNLGCDTYISGTVAAAREAALLGFKSAAVSHYVGKERAVDWNLTALRVRPVVAGILEKKTEPGFFWNINFPHPLDDQVDLDLVFCPLDTSPFDVRFTKKGEAFFWGADYHSRPRQKGRDVDVCFGGKIAVTRIPLEIAGPSSNN